MSHPFGDLLSQYLHRKHGLSQAKLAEGILQDPAVIAKMCKGERLSGQQARERIVAMIDWLHKQRVLNTLDEANVLLNSVGIATLQEKHPHEVELMRKLQSSTSQSTTHPLAQIEQSSQRTNLRAPLTSFIGRERDLVGVKHLINENRLVTLTGAGGMGKTRLSQEAIVHLPHPYADGVWLTELAPLTDPELVADTVARMFELSVTGRGPLEALSDYLRNKQALLILDNCEHVIASCAELVVGLLRACPKLHILTTSREALNVPGEVIWRIPEMIPDEAAALFAERAHSAKPDFALTDANASLVRQLCERLDGMPLAIELAAARLRAMTLNEIAARLDDRFRLLTGGWRTALPRQQTLRATINWSYDLLSESESIVLRRLSVFASGWQADAAQAVCADGEMIQHAEVFDLLFQLVDKSLVATNDSGTEIRYAMLETIRQYGHEKLVESGEYQATRAQHMAFFGQLSSDAVPHLKQLEQISWMKRLVTEMDNIRVGLDWAERTSNATAGTALLSGMSGALTLTGVWYWYGYFDEGAEWTERVILNNPRATPHERLFGLTSSAQFRRHQGQGPKSLELYAQARTLAYQLVDEYYIWRNLNVSDESVPFEKALMLARQAGDPWRIGLSMWVQGLVAMSRDEPNRAEELLAEAYTLLEEIGDRVSTANILHFRVVIALDKGNLVWARDAVEKSLSILQDLGQFIGKASLLRHLASIYLDEGNTNAATVAIKEAIPIAWRANKLDSVCHVLVVAARIAILRGDVTCGIQLAASAEHIRENISWNTGIEHRLYSQQFQPIANLRLTIANAAFNAAWTEGLAMTLEQAIEEALKL